MAPFEPGPHSTLIKALQITSDISRIIICQSFLLFSSSSVVRTIWAFCRACVCVCLCECEHVWTYEQTADLFQHAGRGFYFCFRVPLSYAFSLKEESDLSQQASKKETQKQTEISPTGGWTRFYQTFFFPLTVMTYSAIVVVTWQIISSEPPHPSFLSQKNSSAIKAAARFPRPHSGRKNNNKKPLQTINLYKTS